MLIRKVKMTNFCGITDTVEFPQTGTLLVTGPNGTGKSARYYDAPAWAGWQSTVRGTPPYPLGSNVPVEVALTTDLVEVIRNSKVSPRLTWSSAGHEPVKYETTTKADNALERKLGPMSVWQRTHIFRTKDAASFTKATDAERKRLLEQIIGLDVIDAAYKFVYDSNAPLVDALEKLNTKVKHVEERIAEARRHASDLQAFRNKKEADPGAIQAKLLSLSDTRVVHQDEYQTAYSELTRLNATVAQLQRQQIQHIDGKCYACHQDIDAAVIARQAAELEDAKNAAAAMDVQCRVSMQKASRAMGEIDMEIGRLHQELSLCGQSKVASEKIAALKERYTVDKNELMDLQVDVDLLNSEVQVKTHALRFLNIRGPRTRILAQALRKLEERVNLYLSWINTPARILLHGETEQANGKVVNKIQVEVIGWGGGHGYDACSGGQQRRLDLVFLLALASLSDSYGTLVFDEVFDALDQEGVSYASELLTKISLQRPVVIITHNTELMRAIRGPRVELAKTT